MFTSSVLKLVVELCTNKSILQKCRSVYLYHTRNHSFIFVHYLFMSPVSISRSYHIIALFLRTTLFFQAIIFKRSKFKSFLNQGCFSLLVILSSLIQGTHNLSKHSFLINPILSDGHPDSDDFNVIFVFPQFFPQFLLGF